MNRDEAYGVKRGAELALNQAERPDEMDGTAPTLIFVWQVHSVIYDSQKGVL